MKLKRSMTFATSFAIICSMLTPTFAQTSNQLKTNQPKAQEQNVTSLKYDPKSAQLKEEDNVRIIVELEDAPLIEHATKKGKKVSELDQKTIDTVNKDLKNKQNNVKNKAKSKGIKFKEHSSFTNVTNGFSVTTTLKEARELENIDGVKKVSIVNEYERPTPQMNTSTDMVNAGETWENVGYNGEGTVVAVIDTGVDPNHKDFNLTNKDKAELDKNEIKDIVNKEDLKGTYRNEKVPYGYNYMDDNQEVLDLGPGASEHGMHVAGTVGANGDREKGGIKGVAPETQILAMKVFGNNPQMGSTFGDVIIKAIDDSVILGADVINMSLGSTAAYVLPDDPEQMAVERATENGVVCAISAGNSNVFGSGYDNPYSKNPDIGVVGSPGLANDSIQVASIENTHVTASALDYSINGEAKKAAYTKSGPDMYEAFKGQKLEYVNCGLGKTTDFNDSVKGKIALVQRGEIAFTDKIMNAQNAGAIGVVVYNSVGGGDALINMAYPSEQGGKIPAVFIGYTNGNDLANTTTKEVSFNGKTTSIVNGASGKMSSFSSWGVTPNLDFKPEITAPGGNIWSTAQNDGYKGMSGTSMAAPHVAGGSSLVLQRVDEEFNLSGSERVNRAKNLMMSTAKAHKDQGRNQGIAGSGNYTSPRRQGAGTMDLYAATTTPVIVTAKSGISKVTLKEIDEQTNFTLKLENFSDKDVTYKVNGNVQTDLAYDQYNHLEAQSIYKKGTKEHPITFDKQEITVKANSTAELKVSVDLNNTVTAFEEKDLKEVFENGNFVEGFVTFTDVEDKAPELSIPYVGFYGEWDKANIIDDSIYDEVESFYGLTAMSWLDKEKGEYNFLGYDVNGENLDINNIAFSPNSDGHMDDVVPVVSLLRNAKELDIDILDKDGNVIRDLAIQENLRKNYYDGKYAKHTSEDMWTWDGKANNKVVEDGVYTYRIRTRIDMKDSKWQTVEFPVRVDTVEPSIENFRRDKKNSTLEVVASDDASNVYSYAIVDGDKVVAENSEGKFDLSKLDYSNKARVRVYDYAGNYTEKKLPGKNEIDTDTPVDPENPEVPSYNEPTGPAQGDTTMPTIKVMTPDFLGIQQNSKVVFSGSIEDDSSLEYFRVNGKDAEYKFNTATGKWDFAVELDLEQGYHAVRFEGKDSSGNAIDFVHKIFVDTQAPEISINNLPNNTREDSIVLKGNISDNLPGMRVKVNGNMIANMNADWEEYVDEVPPASYVLDYEVKLQKGKNTIVIEAEDDGGNVSTKTISIVKK